MLLSKPDMKDYPINRDELEAYSKDPQVLVEITSKCNFTCDYCSSAFKERSKVNMTMEMFEHIVKQLPQITRKGVRLHIDGEPTTHPQFVEMGKLVNEYGFRVGLATNGSRLKAEHLDVAGDYLVTISSSPEEFATRSRGIKFDEYIEGVKEYVRNWGLIDNDQSLQISLLKTIGREHDDEYTAGKRAFLDSFIAELELPESVREVDPQNSAMHRAFVKNNGRRLVFLLTNTAGGGLYPKHGEVVENPTTTSGFCDSPWKRLAILADGRVSCCCIDLSGKTAYSEPGEIWDKSLKDLWHEAAGIKSIRDSFLKQEVILPICQRCLGACPDHMKAVGFA